MSKVIDIQKEVNPHFKPVWISKFPYNVLKGGRNSFKSSVVALKLVFMMLSYILIGEKANVVVIRKVANTIRDSVYLKIQWALNLFGVKNQFTATVSPFKITHNKTGSSFYFYGQDDFQKLKSNDINYIIGVWYEEAAEFKSVEDFDQSNVTFMRQKHPLAQQVQFFWSYNPPRNPYSWINEWAESLRGQKNYLVHESSYLDDQLGFINSQMLADIERIKQNDFDYYRYLYLGEPVGLGTNVYNMSLFHPLNELPEDDRLSYICLSADTGHQVSATAVCAFGVTAKGDVILLDTYYYSPNGKTVKKPPTKYSQEIHEFEEKLTKEYNVPIVQRTIDSAEGGLRNQYYYDWSVRWHPVAKKRKIDMVDFVEILLAQGRFFYLNFKSNSIFIDEHKKYQWDEKTLHHENPEVVKEDDHTCDAFQYFCVDMAKTLGLKP